jgi:GH25 family lysozyme M1 (1,4-beta-N-acetylmuramidase)
MMNYQGHFLFDVSTWQDAPTTPVHIDFQKMRDYGAAAVIIRAGQGNWVDPDFPISWQNAKGILPRASYWYYDNRYPPQEQARKYWQIIKYDLEGMCWLDLEDRQAGLYAGWRNWYDFCEELKALYPAVRIGIYTGFYYFWDYVTFATLQQREYFRQYPLWLAWYGKDPFEPNYNTILTPLPWLEYDILQTGTPAIGHDAGVESVEIDLDYFNGDAAKFERFFGARPPVQGENMYSGRTATVAKIWNAIGGGQVNELRAGVSVTGDAPRSDGYVYLRTPTAGWTKKIWLSPYQEVTVTPPPPPVEPPVEPPADTVVANIDLDLTMDINGTQYTASVVLNGVQLKSA